MQCQHCCYNDAEYSVVLYVDGERQEYVVCGPCVPSVSEFATITPIKEDGHAA